MTARSAPAFAAGAVAEVMAAVWSEAVVDGGEARERELHAQFSADRAHGEWFRPSSDLIALIAEAAV